MAKFSHCRNGGIHSLDAAQLWDKYETKGVTENNIYKILRDFAVQCDSLINNRKPDIDEVNKREKQTKITDIAILGRHA